MFEKVNPSHPDKMADRLAGAIVDLAYTKAANPTIAVEVLAGHGHVLVIAETSLTAEQMPASEIDAHILRIFGDVSGEVVIVPQDPHLADNQQSAPRCGDNGIFKGVPPTHEQKLLTAIAGSIYERTPFDGKYIIYSGKHGACFDLTICQSHLSKHEELGMKLFIEENYRIHREYIRINPLGPWSGGPDVDCGATNRKLGSDMGDAVTGGGLMGKDLSKMDVTANILCHLRAQRWGVPVECICAIGDETLTLHGRDGRTEEFSVADAISEARNYIQCLGGFENFAEWGLIRP